ncbi:MAG: hypothetical protein ACFFG0_49795, partial [Candidatus Thorarchaeota archaeon]
MPSPLETIYLNLPPMWKNMVVSIYGYYVRHQRYGKLYHSLLNSIVEREKMSAESIINYQEEALAEMYSYATTNIPYYIDMVKKGIIPLKIKKIDNLAQ